MGNSRRYQLLKPLLNIASSFFLMTGDRSHRSIEDTALLTDDC
ncbi:MAG: hypothetical protein WBA89_11240 [Microcoleus sp.]